MLGVALTSAGPYANYLHLAPDKQPRQYPTSHFLQAGCPSCRPTNSVRALNAKIYSNIMINILALRLYLIRRRGDRAGEHSAPSAV